jgi:hypothetical protein
LRSQPCGEATTSRYRFDFKRRIDQYLEQSRAEHLLDGLG